MALTFEEYKTRLDSPEIIARLIEAGEAWGVRLLANEKKTPLLAREAFGAFIYWSIKPRSKHDFTTPADYESAVALFEKRELSLLDAFERGRARIAERIETLESVNKLELRDVRRTWGSEGQYTSIDVQVWMIEPGENPALVHVATWFKYGANNEARSYDSARYTLHDRVGSPIVADKAQGSRYAIGAKTRAHLLAEFARAIALVPSVPQINARSKAEREAKAELMSKAQEQARAETLGRYAARMYDVLSALASAGASDNPREAGANAIHARDMLLIEIEREQQASAERVADQFAQGVRE